jgi:hypothetical protein
VRVRVRSFKWGPVVRWAFIVHFVVACASVFWLDQPYAELWYFGSLFLPFLTYVIYERHKPL